jgi:uncharacterized membrane protein (UPF0136 family)
LFLLTISWVSFYFYNVSVISAVGGLTFGGLLVGSGVLITQGESYKGHALASGVTGLMTLAMGKRFLSTGKFMPAGMVATLGAAGLAYNVQKALEWMPTKEGTLRKSLSRFRSKCEPRQYDRGCIVILAIC